MKEAQKKKNQAGMFLPNREVSWALAAALILCVTMFTLGYFWGQKRAVSSFLSRVEEESFADKISYSLYAMGGRGTDEEDTDETIVEDPDDVIEEQITHNDETPATKTVSKDIPVLAQPEIKKMPEKVYVAPIVGFGTLHAAQSFSKRVKKLGIDVIIKDRNSTTPKGKKITWYQAVSQEFENKDTLQAQLDIIKKRENIKEIKIIEKKKG